jgi:hypothetical protein
MDGIIIRLIFSVKYFSQINAEYLFSVFQIGTNELFFPEKVLVSVSQTRVNIPNQGINMNIRKP